jgi:hypothetical protein
MQTPTPWTLHDRARRFVEHLEEPLAIKLPLLSLITGSFNRRLRNQRKLVGGWHVREVDHVPASTT